MTNSESQTRSEEMQEKAERMEFHCGLAIVGANSPWRNHTLNENKAHSIAIILRKKLNLPTLLTAEAERDELEDRCKEQHQLLRSVFYAAEFSKNDNGYRLKRLMHCSDNGKEVITELDQRDQLRTELATAKAENAALRDVVAGTIPALRASRDAISGYKVCYGLNDDSVMGRAKKKCEEALRTLDEKGDVL